MNISHAADPEDDYRRWLVLDGIVYPKTRFYYYGERGLPTVAFDKPPVPDELLDAPLGELRTLFAEVSLPPYRVASEFHVRSSVKWRDAFSESVVPRIELHIGGNLWGWKKPWSFSQFMDSIRPKLEERGLKYLEVRGLDRFEFRTVDHALSLRDSLIGWVDEIDAIAKVVEEELNSAVNPTAVLTYFEFPAEISSACQQYLLYFIQFLRDLGISATAELREEAQRVLFSVTPRGGQDALGRIREALNVYLTLPDSPGADSVKGDDLAVIQLRANVLHLQSQVILADAVSRAKDAIIGAQQAQIQALGLIKFQQEQLLLGNRAQAETGDREELIPEAVTLTTLKGKGFEIHLPELLRKLKRRL